MTAPLQTTTAISPQVIANMKQKLRRSVLSPTFVLTPQNPKYPNDANQRTYVENQYDSINVTGINKAPDAVHNKYKADLAPTEEVLLPQDQFDQKTARNPFFNAYRGKSREDRHRMWLEFAQGIAEREALCGFCNLFSMVTVALLVASDSPLPKGTLVEWIGSGHGSSGHMTAVINREPQSDPADPDTWGVNYLFVDYWYALQAGVDPVFEPRTKAAIEAKKQSGTALDAHDKYRLFFDAQGTAAVKGTFHARTYLGLKIKEKTPGAV